MSRAKTSRIKKEVMRKIANLIPEAEVVGRKTIQTPKHTIMVLASRDYGSSRQAEKVHNWYALWQEDLKKDIDMLLFTTGNEKNFVMIPFKVFNKEIKPFLRPTKDGAYFFLFSRDDNSCFVPKDYIPKKVRNTIKGKGIDLGDFFNNLSNIGISYDKYLETIVPSESIPTTKAMDIASMIKLIAEKDPLFLTKSIEEKLIILRYHQIEGEKNDHL